MKSNLISLLDTTLPNANRLFSSHARVDGSEKWADFVAKLWHCECVCGHSERAFVSKYQRWCKIWSTAYRRNRDVCRFHSKKALAAFAGIDAPPIDSDDVIGRHKGMSKVGASSLRRTLFLVMSVSLQLTVFSCIIKQPDEGDYHEPAATRHSYRLHVGITTYSRGGRMDRKRFFISISGMPLICAWKCSPDIG